MSFISVLIFWLPALTVVIVGYPIGFFLADYYLKSKEKKKQKWGIDNL